MRSLTHYPVNYAVYSSLKIFNKRNYKKLARARAQMLCRCPLHVLGRLKKSSFFFRGQHGAGRIMSSDRAMVNHYHGRRGNAVFLLDNK